MHSTTARQGRMPAIITGTIAAALAASLAGCATAAQSASQAALVPRLDITPANGSAGVQPGASIVVRAAAGTISGVKVTGGTVTGRLSHAGTVWRGSGRLAMSRTVKVTATAQGHGRIVTATASFATLKPKKTFVASTIEGYRQRYGVGMPIIIDFSRPITRKAQVERAITLTTSRPVTGAWFWDGSKTLYFRPRGYWPQHTVVSFDGHFAGVQGAPGVYGARDLTQTFRIGPSLIVVASTRTHYMNVYYKRKFWRRWPISTGRPGDDTPNGTYVTIDKGNPVDMVGPGYNLEVPWSVRFTWSGVYIHDAYWSVGEQGVTNVSHGCVNTSPAHAEEYYKLAVPGDPVTVTGSPQHGTWNDGWTVWFMSWKSLVRGSALDQAVIAGPHGSSFVSPAAVPAVAVKAPLSGPRRRNSRAQA